MARHPTTLQTSGAGATALRYVPGLDGIRALSVIAVLLYHAGLPVGGGFLGVEVFFVLSGFLITALLVAEWERSGRINLPAFWLRRARRLLPALFALFAGTLLIGAVVLQRMPADLRGDLLASLGYVMNWRLILGGQSYFDPLVRPSLLQHLWSLAVEEQFYLLWPMIFVVGMRVLRRRGLLALTLVGALGSLALMAWLYRPGADPSRIYYGTDTRAGGVLLGAALALVWAPPAADAARRGGWALDLAGGGALVALLACFGWLVNRSPLLYRGGFALVDALTLVLIVAAASPEARVVRRLLELRPLQWIGLRSYGLYLWHWPIFNITRPLQDLPLTGLPLLALRLVIVGVLVELSYRLIELPVRRGALRTLWSARAPRSLPAPHPAPRPSRAVRLAGLLLPVLILTALGTRSVGGPLPQTAAGRPTLPTSPSLPVAAIPRPTAQPAAAPSVAPEPAAAPAAADTAPATVAPTATPMPTAPQPLDPALAAALQALLDATVADGAIPGAELAVHIPGYQSWAGASGVANRASGQAMQPDTLVHISSITKMFTAVVVLQLAQEGRLDLDAPIATWLPEIVPLSDRTTVRQLLSHTSGIFDYLEDSRFFVEAYQNPDRTYTPEELVGFVDDFGAAFEPGTSGAWKYASTNYVILGMLVERVTGRPLVAEMRARILAPLGLSQTFFAPYEPVPGDIAQGYIDGSDRANISMTFVFATGNIISTAGDMARFADALFGGQLLSPEALAQMEAFIYTGGGYDMPELEYGLGLMRARMDVGPGANNAERPPEITTVVGHIGGIAGFRSAVWHAPGTGITIALGVNQADVDPNILARDALETILDWQGQ